MIRVRRKIIEGEILLALRLGALGQWWAASAVRRLSKLSGEHPTNGTV